MKILLIAIVSSPLLLAYYLRPEEMQQAFVQILLYLQYRVMG